MTTGSSSSLAAAPKCSPVEVIGASLFERVGILLQIQVYNRELHNKSNIITHISNVIFLKIRDYRSTLDKNKNTIHHNKPVMQLLFEFMSDETPYNIVILSKCVSHRRAKGALDRDVIDFLGKHKVLRQLGDQLYDRDVKWLGDLIKLSEEDLMAYPGMTSEKLALVKERLTVFKFSLSMRTPGWERPSECFGGFGFDRPPSF